MYSRITQSLNLDWQFLLGDEPRAWQTRFDDTKWQRVNLPHDWSVKSPFSLEHSSGTGYLPGGVGWYRKRFKLPVLEKDAVITICFEGVYNNSQVWCNGHYLGKRPYGYSEFVYDVSHCVRPDGGENIVIVRVNHAHAGDSRWFTGSGIYRGASVTVAGAVSVATYGIHAYTRDGDAARGLLTVETKLRNTTPRTTGLELKQTLIKDGATAAETSKKIDLQSGSVAINQEVTQEIVQELSIPAPILWSPENPALYTLVTEILRDGDIIDRVETVTGLRDIKFDPDKGFSCNGKSYKFKGVCVHHDAGCLGAAVRPKVWRRRLEILKAAGCNAIRTSHNPHMTALYDLCDELGFFVIDEAFDEWEGVKNKWTAGHNVYPPAHYGYYEDFPVWHEEDLKAMVLRDRNHPSVILWSIGNEIDYPNDPYVHPFILQATGNNDANKPPEEMMYDSGKPNAERLTAIAKVLVDIVKQHDCSRPVTAGLAFPELSTQTGLAQTLDVTGYNYKEQFYAEHHEKFPNQIIMGSENGHHLSAWHAVTDNEYISGQFLWTGIDFLGETGGWPYHGSSAGILDIAGFEKPLYYMRQALWLDKPVVNMAASYPTPGRVPEWRRRMTYKLNWNFLAGEKVDVMIATNCDSVELLLNGRSLGIKEADGRGEPIIWSVDYEKGELKAIARKGGETAECALKSSGAAVAVKAQVWEDELYFDGQDMTHIVFRLVDTDGNPVEDAYDLIDVTVEGGELLGLESGDLSDITPYTSQSRRAYKGRLLAYIGAPNNRSAAEIRVRATGLGLKGTELVISPKAPCTEKGADIIRPGTPWLDNNGKLIQAHGGGILTMMQENGETVYYWYGEDKTHGYRPLVGVHAYKSTDLLNWTDCGVALKAMLAQDEFDQPYFKELYGELAQDERLRLFRDLDKNTAVMERPKVIYNAKNNNYIMWFHADGPTETSDANYAKAKAAVAVSDSPAGPFKLLGSYRLDHYGGEDYLNNPGMARDMGLFVDGTDAYIIYASEENYTLYISRLNEDYTMIASGGVESPDYAPIAGKDYVRIFPKGHREAPAVFKHNGKYYMMTSGCTGWRSNPALYGVSDSILGEWKQIGDPCVDDINKTTFDSQSTFILPINPDKGKYLYMGDRWISRDLANSSYIWLPLEIDGDGVIRINWADEWSLTDFAR